MQEETATLIKWSTNVDPKRIQAWLEKLVEAGHAEGHQTQNYNPDHSFPVLYFP